MPGFLRTMVNIQAPLLLGETLHEQQVQSINSSYARANVESHPIIRRLIYDNETWRRANVIWTVCTT